MSEQNGSTPEGGASPLDLMSGYVSGGENAAEGPVPEISDGPGIPEVQESPEGETEAVSTGEPDISGEPEVDLAKQQAEEIQQELSKVSTYTIKNGDEELELRADALIPVKVDGEIQHIKLSDYRNEMSGEIAIKTRISDLGRKNKELTTKLEQFKEAGNSVLENPLGVIEKIAEISEVDRAVVFEKMISQALKLSEELDELGEDGRANLINEYRMTSKQKELEAKEARVNETMTKAEVGSYTQSKLTESEVSEAEFREFCQSVESGDVKMELPEDPKQAVDKLIQGIQIDKAYSKIESVVDKIAPELSENDNFIDTIYKVAGTLSRDKIEAIVKHYKDASAGEDSSRTPTPDENEGRVAQAESSPSEENYKSVDTYGNDLLDMVMGGKL